MKEMIKKYRGSLISSILVIFVGVLVGFTSTHGKWINVFFVVTHCIFVAIIFYDNRSRQQSPKVIGMAIWMIPVITLLYNGIARLVNTGADMENLFMAFMLRIYPLIIWNAPRSSLMQFQSELPKR